MRRTMLLLGAALILAAVAAPSSWAESRKKAFTTEFGIERCTFSPTGVNPYFILTPGFVLTLEGEEDKELVHLTITVLNETLDVDGVTTRIIEEEEIHDGELAEISRNYYAICQETDSVYYFGEDTDIYEDGEIVSHEGSWLAGENGASAGIYMPGTILLGSRYYQEIAPDVALDRAEITSIAPCEVLDETVDNCVETVETSPLEPGAKELKRYAPDIGVVLDDTLELIDVQQPD